MSESLINQWLYASEGDSLDFKREQYRFIGASEIEKSRLLRDILSIANSWRREEGYIVIGIEDRPEKPNILLGISDHIDDAQLQQFVNSKTESVCNFKYSTCQVGEKTLGIISIPVQNRPIFLKADYSNLREKTVYIRRGSSSFIASPREIIDIGLAHLKEEKPALDLNFFDSESGTSWGSVLCADTKHIDITDEIPDYSQARSVGMFVIGHPGDRAEYYRELVEYVNFNLSYFSIKFCVKNNGRKEAVNVRLEIEIENKSNSVFILLDGDEVEIPESNFMNSLGIVRPAPPSSEYSLDERAEKFMLYNHLDRLHAQRFLEFPGTVYIRSITSAEINITTRLFFDGQPIPQEKNLLLKMNCSQLSMEWDDFDAEYFKKKSSDSEE